MLNKYFDKVVMINLAKEKDRLASATKACEEQGIEFERINAVSGRSKFVQMNREPYEGWNRNASALALTTVRLIKRAKKEGWKNVFIMEDDVRFIPHNFNAILDKAMKGLPEDWDFFHLNSTHEVSSKWVNSCLHKLGGAWCCQAYAVNAHMYDLYIEELEKYTMPIDNVTLNFHKSRGRSYCTVPDIVMHIPGQRSTLREKIVEY